MRWNWVLLNPPLQPSGLVQAIESSQGGFFAFFSCRNGHIFGAGVVPGFPDLGWESSDKLTEHVIMSHSASKPCCLVLLSWDLESCSWSTAASSRECHQTKSEPLVRETFPACCRPSWLPREQPRRHLEGLNLVIMLMKGFRFPFYVYVIGDSRWGLGSAGG